MDRFRHLFDVNTYVDEECVHFCKGASEEALGEPVLMPESIFSRLTFIGQAYSLHYIPLFDLYSDKVFKKTQVGSLVEELNFVLAIVDDQVLRHFVVPVIQLSEAIVRSRGDYVLQVLGV